MAPNTDTDVDTDTDGDTTTALRPADLAEGDVLTNTARKPARGPNARRWTVIDFDEGHGFSRYKTQVIVEEVHRRSRTEQIPERHLRKHWVVLNDA